MAITLLLSSLSALYFGAFRQEKPHIASAFMISAGVMLGVTLLVNVQHYLDERASSPAQLTPVNHPERRIRWIPTLIGLTLLLLMAEINGNIIDPKFLRHVRANDQFLILVEGILFLVWGLAGKRVNPPENRPTIRERLGEIDKRELLAVGLILLLAFGLRWWRLSTAVHLFVDEIHFSNPVMGFYQVNDVELLRPFSSVAAFPYIYPYMQYHAVHSIGRSLAGLRTISVVFGVLNVVAVYLLAKELFNKPTALLAMVIIAVYPPHLQFSRLGLNNIADPLFGTLTLYFLVRGINSKYDMRVNFAWAGASLGLTQYFYEGGRIFYPILAMSWLALVAVISYMLISWRVLIARLKRNTHDIMTANRRLARVDIRYLTHATLVFLSVFMLVSFPVYYTLIGLNKPLISRLETAGVSEQITNTFDDNDNILRHISNRFEEAFLIHVAIPEASLYYAGETALILSFAVPFFFLGMFYAFWRIDRIGGLLLLMWVLGTWVGNIFMQESRISARYVVEFPAVAIAIGVGLNYGVLLLFPKNPRTRNRVLTACVSLLIVFHVSYFFGSHLPIFNAQFRDDINRNLDSDDVLFRSARFPANTKIHLVGSPLMPQRDATNILNFLADGLQIYTLSPEEFDEQYLNTLNDIWHHAFYLTPDDEQSLNRLLEYFPDVVGPFYSEFDVPMDKQFVLYYIEGFFTPLTGTFPTP